MVMEKKQKTKTKKIKSVKSNECRAKGCTKEVYSKGLCTKHYKQHHKVTLDKGVYILFIKHKFYIGSSGKAGIVKRIQRHKTALIKNNKKNAIAKVLECFNALCEQYPVYSRKEVWDKFVSFKTLESAPILVARTENGLSFNSQDARDGFQVLNANPDIAEKCKNYWENAEGSYIQKYKKIDGENCLNTRKKDAKKKKTRGA